MTEAPILKIDESARADAISTALKSFFGKGFLSSVMRMPTSRAVAQMLAFGATLRNDTWVKEPTLSAAIFVFQQLASSREWLVSGKKKPAARAVDCLNSTRSPDLTTGDFTEGLEEALRRRSLDYAMVGRRAYLNRVVPGQPYTRLEYLDPTLLKFARTGNLSNLTPVRPSERVWQYNGEEFRFDQIVIDHTIPVGSKGLFVAPLMALVPMISLALLISDHDASSLDGRRIRDLLMVASDEARDAIINAILIQVALYAGKDPAEVGVPVVSLNLPSGAKVADLVASVSLSKLPEDFDREKFMFTYVNQIAGALGLALRHFWNDERTTNKALEQVQEQRQQRKVPSEFVNSEERTINRFGVLNQFGGRVRFGFVEEIDSQAQLTNAQVLKATAEALEKIAGVFQASLSLEALLAWMQSIRVLPNELELIDANAETALLSPQSAQSLNREKALRRAPLPRLPYPVINPT